MIVEAIVNVLVALVTTIGNLMPNMDAPSFVSSITSSVATVTGAIAPLGTWVPFGAAGQATSLLLSAIGVALIIKVIRIAVSLFTGGGGGAA